MVPHMMPYLVPYRVTDLQYNCAAYLELYVVQPVSFVHHIYDILNHPGGLQADDWGGLGGMDGPPSK